MHTPDNWIIVKVITSDNETIHKVLGGWHGGYLDGDRWRMNSGIASVKEESDCYDFIGHSGSIYRCHKDGEKLSMITSGIFEKLKQEYPDKIFQASIEDVKHLMRDGEVGISSVS